MDSFFFLLWIVVGPVLPSIAGTSLAYFALRRGKPFLYKTLSCAAIAMTCLSIYAAWSVFYGEAGRDAQAGLVFVFLPLWLPFFFIVTFVFLCGAFVLFGDDFYAIRKKFLPGIRSLAFKISISLIGVYFLSWLSLYLKPGS